MGRIIDADALKETICNHVYPVKDAFNSRDYGMFWTGGIEKAIDEQPTIDLVKHGRWMHDRDDELFSGYCSCCGWTSIVMETDVAGMPYCPNCGARMVEEG